MTVAQLQSRVAKLEIKVATLEEQLERSEAVAGIKRGLASFDRGDFMPAREWAKKVRAKHKLTKR